MAIDLAALKTELQTDPTSLGYAPFIAPSTAAGDGKGDDASPARLINQPNAATPQFRSDVTIHDIVAAIAPTDFAALTALQIAKLQLLFSGVSTIDATVATTRNIIQGIFTGASTATMNALVAMAKRPGSRAEVLFGAGAVVTPTQVALALRG